MSSTTFQAICGVVSVVITLLAGWGMRRNTRVILADSFAGNPKLAGSIQNTVSLGFYLFMFGELVLANGPFNNYSTDVAMMIWEGCLKIGFMCLVLGTLHFVVLFLVTRIGNKARRNAANGDSILA